MASTKNPLAALLKTDERKQVQELQRDHVLRSSVRQAGTYGVNVQQPLPVSQTGLGRLSNSLGTVSGILNQFSEYQMRKEQAEFQGESIQHKMKMQGIQGEQAKMDLRNAEIRGEILNETVQQQLIELDLVNQKSADASFDLMLSNANPEQRAEMNRKAEEQVRLTKERARLAELGYEVASDKDHKESLFYGERALRLIGGTNAAEFDKFLTEKTQEYLNNIADLPGGASMTREEALELAENVTKEFMELKKLDPDGPVGRGFLNATEKFREDKIPSLASRLVDQSEALNTENMITVMQDWLDVGDLENVEHQDWYAQISGMSKFKALGALFGTAGNAELGLAASPGLFGVTTKTHDGAVKFQRMFDMLTESGFQLDGKPFEDYYGFDSLQAQVEEAVENTAAAEVNKGENALLLAQKKALPRLTELAVEKSASERAAMSMNLIQQGDSENPEPLRGRITEVFGIDTSGIPDEQVVPFAGYLLGQIHGIGDTHNKQTAALLTKAVGKHYIRYDEPKGLAVGVMNSKRLTDTSPNTAEISAFYGTLLNGYGDENHYDGLSEQGGGYMVNEFDEMSGGAVTQYKEDLNNLKSVVEAMLPDNATDEEFTEAYRAKYKELQENFEGTIARVVTEQVGEQQRVLAILSKDVAEVGEALLEVSKVKGFEGLEGATSLDPVIYADVIDKNPLMTVQEAMEETKRRGGTLETPGAKTLSVTRGKTSKEATQILTARDASVKKYENLYNSVTKPGGDIFAKIQQVATPLGKGDFRWFSNEPVRNYRALMGKANEVVRGKAALGVTPKELAEYSAYNAVNRKLPMLVMSGRKFLRTYPRGRRPKASSMYKQTDSILPRLHSGFGGAYHREVVRKRPDFIERDENGDLKIDADWYNKIEEDLTLPPDFFLKTQAPLLGIPFGDAPPKKSDIENLREKLGWDAKDLENAYTVFGFDNPLTFFRSQYNNSYYFNQRAKAK